MPLRVPLREMPNDDMHRLLIGKHIDYQIGLVNRRWQYFATYLLVNGLLFNVWKDIGKSEIVFIILLSAESIIVSCVFLQLISLATKHIERSQAYLVEANADVVHAPLHGKFFFGESTFLLYCAYHHTSIGWFYLLYLANSIIASIRVAPK